MQWPKTKTTGKEGVLYVMQVVNDSGHIFREIHLEDDTGLDGVIEFVDDCKVTGRLLAVQVKSGDSYLASSEDKFVVSIDQDHLNYWQHYDLPVVLVCYSPSKKLAAWQDVKWYIQYKRRLERVFPQEKVSIKSIEVPFENAFDRQGLVENLYNLTSEHSDQRFLLKKAEMILSNKADERREGLLYFWFRREVLATRLMAFLASQLILDERLDIVRLAARTLGYCVAQNKWDFYPDFDLMNYAFGLCMHFGKRHVRCLLECVEDGDFGPMSLGEACLDCIGCMWAPDGEMAMRQIVEDKHCAMYVRANALLTFYACSLELLLSDDKVLQEAGLGDILAWIKTEGYRQN